jgi:plastocyanin domain-containing protein
VPNSAQDFDYTAGGGLSPASFSLDDDADGTLAASRSFDDVVPGSGYSLSQTPPSGWELASATCDDGSPVSNIDVAAGETVTCTFTHEQQGSITVVKDAQPNDAQNFSFTAGGGLSPSSFQLDDDADGTLSDSRTFSGVSAQSGYSLSESATAGWDLSTATCDDGSAVSNISVSPAEHVTCTFTNRKRGQIVVVQDSQPNDAQDFSFTAGGGLSPSSFSLDDDSNPTLSNTRTFADVQVGSGYSISQTLPSGWALGNATCDDGSPVSNIDVGAGETVTCTFTNDRRGTIVVVKDAVPNDAQDFSFTAGGGLSPSSFSLDDDADGTLSNTRTFDDLPAGSGYSVAESLPSGWSQASATCDDGSPVSNIDVAAGETVTCTFLNQHPYPRPKGATPLKTSLVTAFAACTTPNRTHGPSLEHPSCNPPAQTSSQLTVGNPPDQAANMQGSVTFEAMLGNVNTPADEADVAISVNITDVRLRSTFNDYTGQLQSAITLRITDRLNGPSLNEVGTTADTPFNATIPCATTASTTIGSTCSLSTTADAVIPGMVTEVKRTIWQIGDVRIFDGGPDGQASTQDNTLFLRQGLFVP